MAADTPNEKLGELLACLSWSGERLAREICRVLGTGAVHPTAPYKWLKGHQPSRDEVRQVTAFVLSQASSQLIAVSELWPGCAAHESRLIPATAGMRVPWTLGTRPGIWSQDPADPRRTRPRGRRHTSGPGSWDPLAKRGPAVHGSRLRDDRALLRSVPRLPYQQRIQPTTVTGSNPVS